MNIKVFNPEDELRMYLYVNKEKITLKRPSKYFLKKYAEKILYVAKIWQNMNKFSVDSYISVMHSVDIFITDLDSDLEISNDSKYKIFWDNKFNELKSIQNQFLKEYTNELEKNSE